MMPENPAPPPRENPPSQRKDPSDNSQSPVKIKPVPLTSPRVKLSWQRESKKNEKIFVCELWQIIQV